MAIFRRNRLLPGLLLPLFIWLTFLVSAQSPGNLLYEEAMAKYQQKSFTEAAKLFEKYVATTKAGQYLPESYYYLAGLQEDFQKTIIYYQKIIQDFPESPLVDDAYYQLGMTHLLLSDYRVALSVFEKLLSQFSTSTYADQAQYQLGKTRLTLNQVAEAKTAFQKVLKEYQGSPQVPKAILGLADCLRQENKHEEALKELLIFEKLYPQSDLKSLAYFNIAESYRALGDNTQADTYYNKVISLYPDSFEAEEARKRILATPVKTAFFSVQLGAFSVKNNALRLKERLRDKGFKDVYLQKRESGGKTLSLVLIGHFQEKSAAQRVLESVKREVSLSPRVVFFNPHD